MIKKTLKTQCCNNNMKIQILMMNNIDYDVNYVKKFHEYRFVYA